MSKHPTAKHDRIRQRIAAEPLGARGWKYDEGFRVVFVAYRGGFEEAGAKTFVQAKTYIDAVRLRDEGMRSGKYDLAWIRENQRASL